MDIYKEEKLQLIKMQILYKKNSYKTICVCFPITNYSESCCSKLFTLRFGIIVISFIEIFCGISCVIAFLVPRAFYTETLHFLLYILGIVPAFLGFFAIRRDDGTTLRNSLYLGDCNILYWNNNYKRDEN